MLDAASATRDASPYLPLQQDFAELLPGNCLTMPFISRVKSVARTWEEFKHSVPRSRRCALVDPR
jgi:hypothetical protein